MEMAQADFMFQMVGAPPAPPPSIVLAGPVGGHPSSAGTVLLYISAPTVTCSFGQRPAVTLEQRQAASLAATRAGLRLGPEPQAWIGLHARAAEPDPGKQLQTV